MSPGSSNSDSGPHPELRLGVGCAFPKAGPGNENGFKGMSDLYRCYEQAAKSVTYLEVRLGQTQSPIECFNHLQA